MLLRRRLGEYTFWRWFDLAAPISLPRGLPEQLAVARYHAAVKRAVLLGLGAVALVAGAAPARAGGISVGWSAPPVCGSVADLRVQLVEHLGRPLAATDLLVAEVAVSRDGGIYRARIRLPDAGGERVVADPDCAVVRDAVALVLALVIRDRAARPWAAPSLPAATPPPAPAPRPPPAIRAPPPLPRGWRVRLAAGVDTAAGFGALPGADLGAGVVAVAAVGSWRAAGGLLLWRQGRAQLGAGGLGANIDLWTVRLRGCRVVRWIVACPGMEIGQMHGAGVGYLGAMSGSQRWLAATAAVGAERHLAPRIRVSGTVEAVVPIGAPRFVTADGDPIYAPSAVGARFGVALLVDLR